MSLKKFFDLAPEPPTELGRLRILSSTAGIRVSPLQLGAMSIGDAWAGGMGSMDKDSAFRLLDAYVAAGGNFIDTANSYQDEQSESWIGEWMEARGNREQLVIATKFSSNYLDHAAGKGLRPNNSGNHRRSIRTSLRDSLRKLKTDYVDILYLHWWDYTTSIPEIMDTLHVAVEQGLVNYLGISDTPAWIVAAANTYALDHGRTPFSIYQGRWNILRRDFERDIIPMARHFGMALAPWDAIGGGKFQNKRAIEERSSRGEGLRKFLPGQQAGQTDEEERVSEVLAEVASEHGIESVTAIALAYVMHKAQRVYPIVGGRRVEHLQDNIQALSIKLTPEQIQRLESVKEFDVGFPKNFIDEDPNVTGRASIHVAQSARIAFPHATGL